MKKIKLLAGFVLLSLASIAQQDVQFTQYMFNTNAVNPAYTGSRGAISGVALFRTQWVGFEGAPVTQSINVNSPFLNDKLGIGFTVLNEKIGPLKQTGIFTDFAYRIKFEKSTLALGLKAGADIFQAGFNSLNVINAGDNQFQTNVSSKLLPNLGFGIYYHAERYYLGFSTPKLVQNNIDVQTGSSSISQVGVHKMHYYFIGGYVQDINPFIKFRPTVQAKLTYGAPVSLDANASFLFFDKLWLGGMYRLGDAVGMLVQFQFNTQLRAGYSYDYTTSRLNKFNNGTHEVMLGYDLSFAKEKIRSPRFF
jgi:type IX secretion system PorP/SprF family membrane protein